MTPLRTRMLGDLRIRNRKPSTQERYVKCVAAFARYFGKSPAELGPEEIRTYLLYLRDEKKASFSVFNITVSALRFLYKFTLDKPWAIERIPYAKCDRKLPVVLSPQEVIRLFEATTNAKHRALLMTAYSAGLRRSEVTSIAIGDIDSDRMVLNVRLGKGGKDRTVPLSPKLLRMLRAYWREYRPARPWLFEGQDPNKHLSPESAAAICRNAVKAAGLTKRVSMHTLRHTFATHHLEAGTDLHTLQQILGHASINSTQIYLHISTRRIQEAQTPFELIASFQD